MASGPDDHDEVAVDRGQERWMRIGVSSRSEARRAAAAAAVSNARALLRHSRSSSSGDGIGDDPGAGLERGLAVAPDHRADRDRGVEVAGEVDVADDARVRARAWSARARR